MSRPGSDPEPGVYDVLLAVAVGALLCGVLMLFLQLQTYGFQTAP